MATIAAATFEGSLDHHQSWFNVNISSDAGDAHSGAASLLVELTDAFTGVQLDNYPYYSGIVAGADYDFGIWYREAVATAPTVNWNIRWFDVAAGLLQTDVIPLPRQAAWAHATQTLTAPVGAVTLGWTFTTTTGTGSAYRVDDLSVADAVTGPEHADGQTRTDAGVTVHAGSLQRAGGGASSLLGVAVSVTARQRGAGNSGTALGVTGAAQAHQRLVGRTTTPVGVSTPAGGLQRLSGRCATAAGVSSRVTMPAPLVAAGPSLVLCAELLDVWQADVQPPGWSAAVLAPGWHAELMEGCT